jgi:hypothetical protein
VAREIYEHGLVLLAGTAQCLFQVEVARQV